LFEPVNIGDRSFADSRLGANNPADEVEGEALNILCSETKDLKALGEPRQEAIRGQYTQVPRADISADCHRDRDHREKIDSEMGKEFRREAGFPV
jgi:hypothetical protein